MKLGLGNLFLDELIDSKEIDFTSGVFQSQPHVSLKDRLEVRLKYLSNLEINDRCIYKLIEYAMEYAVQE